MVIAGPEGPAIPAAMTEHSKNNQRHLLISGRYKLGTSSPKEIADGMLKIFDTRKQSVPEIFARSAVDGFMSTPENLWMLTKDFLDTDHRWRNETDKIRLLTLTKKGFDFRICALLD